MAIGTVPSLLAASQSGAGILSGKAEAAKPPYSDYKVQVRDVTTGQIVTSAPLDQQGRFAFSGLGLPGRCVVELVTGNQVKCTAGPCADDALDGQQDRREHRVRWQHGAVAHPARRRRRRGHRVRRQHVAVAVARRAYFVVRKNAGSVGPPDA